MMAKPCVELWYLFDGFFALLIPSQTGILLSNQVGGTACDHPEIEGLAIPLPINWLPEKNPLQDYYPEKYDPIEVARFLATNEDLKKTFEPLTSEEVSALGETANTLAEAWVPVKVRTDAEDMLKDLRGRVGVLTYSNSD